jgi:hypothetical protein
MPTDVPTQQRVENDEYAAMLCRMIDAYGRRVGEADPYDLADLVGMSEQLRKATRHAVARLRARDYSWTEIGDGAGTTRQAAQQRWG